MNQDDTKVTRASVLRRRRGGLVKLVLVGGLAFALGAAIFGGDGGPADRQGEPETEATSEATLWTCSMHPQIKLPEPGKCPICFMDLIPLKTDPGEDLGPRQLRMSQSARQLARIQTATVRRAFAEAEIRMVGRLAYDETKVAYITAWVPGRLDRLYADYTGVPVQKGDHLVSMYSPQLLAAQEELVQARRAIDALAQSQSRMLLSTARATLEASRDKLRLLGLTHEQIEEIETSGETSDHLTIYAPIGGVVVAKDALEGIYVNTGSRIYTIADLKHLWVLFEAYESDLPWLRYGQHVNFTSPSFPGESFDAVISFIDPMVDPKTRTVRVRAVVHNASGRLKPDMFTSGIVHSRIDQDGHVLDIQLAGKWIGPMHPEIVKNGPGTCDICGMALVPAETYGYAEQVADNPEAPLLVPATAPLLTGTRAVVYVELPDRDEPVFEGREVELGPRAGDFYVVRSGLQEGDRVVINGAFKIDAELQIQAKPSMMSPEGGAVPAPHHHESTAATSAESAGASSASSQDSPPVSVSPEAMSALTPIYAAYLTLQAALAEDDFDSARKAFDQVVRAVDGVDMVLFEGAAHRRWMELASTLKSEARAGAGAAEIEAARLKFYDVSRAVIDLHSAFGHADDRELFVAHCPMARDNQGADWIQAEDVIHNPYFGAKMPRCGSITEVLGPGSPDEGRP